MSVQPVHGERALEVTARGRRYLVAADLHVGLEEELERRGFRVPDQTGRTLGRLERLVEERRPDELVLLGDVKHQVPFAERREKRKVFRLLDLLADLLPVTVVTGNHDGGIAGMAPERVRRRTCLVAGGTGLAHGHSWPSEALMRCSALVVGHAHPSVLLRDERGRSITEACWLRARFLARKAAERYRPPHPALIVLPAFNDLWAGSAVNVARRKLPGPLFRNGLVDVRSARVYLTDGTFLGRVGDLETEGPRRGRGPS